MAKKVGLGPVKRFGARYGRTIKHKLAKIEREYKREQKCPFRHYEAVKRLAVGIWGCKKCSSIFTGRAYTPGTRIGEARV